jgi:hypothetical protein
MLIRACRKGKQLERMGSLGKRMASQAAAEVG